ncbi:hypothetical protein HAX54_014592, partial [Datura stramonium]|nr:hypothetical protein [Datura stramonium]
RPALAWRKVVVSRGILTSRSAELARGEHCRTILRETLASASECRGVVLWALRAEGTQSGRWPRVGQLGRVVVMLIERLQRRLWCGHVCVPFDVRQADPVECGELVAVLGIDGEEGT